MKKVVHRSDTRGRSVYDWSTAITVSALTNITIPNGFISVL